MNFGFLFILAPTIRDFPETSAVFGDLKVARQRIVY
jgi:hypothetical protein